MVDKNTERAMAGNPVLTAALAAYDAGLCPIRPSLDGSKAPLGKWAAYQKVRPTRELIAQWFALGFPALGTVTGKLAKGLEAFEFDDEASRYQLFKDADQAAGLGHLVECIEAGYLEQSPSGGIHWLYRCPDLEELDGNTKAGPSPEAPRGKDPRQRQLPDVNRNSWRERFHHPSPFTWPSTMFGPPLTSKLKCCWTN
jgi:Bifunctional DNA primase/polymerase, N-terminal